MQKMSKQAKIFLVGVLILMLLAPQAVFAQSSPEAASSSEESARVVVSANAAKAVKPVVPVTPVPKPAPVVREITFRNAQIKRAANSSIMGEEINWSFTVENAANTTGTIEVIEKLYTRDYSYGSDDRYTYTRTRTVPVSALVYMNTKIYCIGYGGDEQNQATRYEVTCGGKTTTWRLPMRAASFAPGGNFWTW